MKAAMKRVVMTAPHGTSFQENRFTILPASGEEPAPMCMQAVQTTPLQKGDVNKDGTIDLKDVMLSVQTATGLPVAVYTEADVNSDGKIGNEEAVFGLQKVGGSRP